MAVMFDINKLDQNLKIYKEILSDRLGNKWPEPDALKIYPPFIIKSRDETKIKKGKKKIPIVQKPAEEKPQKDGTGDQAERELLLAAKKLTPLDNCPHGYFIFDTKLEKYDDDNCLQIDAIFVSPAIIIVFEAKQYHDLNDAIKTASRQLDKRVKAISDIVETNIPVRGAIVVPLLDKDSEQIKADGLMYDILFKQDLQGESFLEYFKRCLPVIPNDTSSASVTKEIKENSMAKLLLFTFLREVYPDTEEEAIHLEAQKIFLQKGRKYKGVLKQSSFNSINFTEEQKRNANSMQSKSTVINGHYGCGKTITLIKALQTRVKSLKKGENINILFISAQTALNEFKELLYSPFLENVKVWIQEALSEYDCIIKSYNDKDNSYNEDIPVFIETCLLSRDLLEHMKHNSSTNTNNTFTALPLTDYNVIILEETNALTVTEMDICTRYFHHIHRKVTWVTSSMSDTEFSKKYPGFKEFKFEVIHVNDNSMRNTLDIIVFSNLLEKHIAPEYFPSSEMRYNNTPEGIPVSYYCAETEILAMEEITLTVQKWLNVSKFQGNQLLIIDAENEGTLLSSLKSKGISFRLYNKHGSENDVPKCDDVPLFLQSCTDPVESTLSGGEWAVVMIYIKYETIRSLESVHLFNKRIISRTAAKLYLFSNYPVEEVSSETDTIIHETNNQATARLTTQNLKQLLKSIKSNKLRDQVQLSYFEGDSLLSNLQIEQRHSKVDEQKIDEQKGLITDDFLVVANGFKIVNFGAFRSNKQKSAIFVIQHLDVPATIYLRSIDDELQEANRLSTDDELEEAKQFFFERFNLRLTLDNDFGDEGSRLIVLLDTVVSVTSAPPVTKSGWSETSGHEDIQEFMKSLKTSGGTEYGEEQDGQATGGGTKTGDGAGGEDGGGEEGGGKGGEEGEEEEEGEDATNALQGLLDAAGLQQAAMAGATESAATLGLQAAGPGANAGLAAAAGLNALGGRYGETLTSHLNPLAHLGLHAVNQAMADNQAMAEMEIVKTTMKHSNFISEPMQEKSVMAVPGIGSIYGAYLINMGFHKAYHLLGKFLMLNRDPYNFTIWLRSEVLMDQLNAVRCCNALQQWCQQFM